MKNLYQIREISVLSFNERVLQEALDPRNPLLERLKFLGIFSSNMDEFFKVRVASIQRRLELGKNRMADLLEMVGDEARELDERFREAYQEITAALAGPPRYRPSVAREKSMRKAPAPSFTRRPP